MAAAQSQDSEAQRPLYGRLMGAIDVQHTWGNRVGFVKLPLILTDKRLYGGAIAQFYFLTERLEARLREHAAHPLVKHLLDELDLKPIAPGYEADLAQIFGVDDERTLLQASLPAGEEAMLNPLSPSSPERARKWRVDGNRRKSWDTMDPRIENDLQSAVS